MTRRRGPDLAGLLTVGAGLGSPVATDMEPVSSYLRLMWNAVLRPAKSACHSQPGYGSYVSVDREGGASLCLVTESQDSSTSQSSEGTSSDRIKLAFLHLRLLLLDLAV